MKKISLATLKPNECGKVCEILGGGHARSRLYELGLNKGAQVKMVKNDLGPLILRIGGHKLALGKGLASKIYIEK